jgi:uncharacterized phage-associated protein
MPNHLAMAIANEFLRHYSDRSIPAQLQLQKWVFNAHGWNLAVNRQPLVREPAQAWDNGPVFRSLWNHIRDHGFGERTRLLEDPTTGHPYVAQLSIMESEVIEKTWERYRSFTGDELSQMSHEVGTPWASAYFGRGRNAAISNVDAQSYFTRLALAGRV